MIDTLLAAPARLGAVRLLAVDGPSGAGKSTHAARIVAGLRARGCRTELVSTDAFATWDDPVAWWPKLVEGVLEPLAAGRDGAYRRMDWSTGAPRPGVVVRVPVPDVLVLEGVSSGRTSARPLLSHLCWVSGGTEAERLTRSVARDGETARAELSRWQRFERGWFAVDGTPEAAGTRLS
ncbi:uridine kinase [Amycolatopsis sp. OK19-0408]|uniref:Uridine kinase n=1 Tax=Amycolatopsis iheyensis TaxID=2945988 RepID=A0A9X2SG28_9PSEU|nr:uridine kinase [Amycolatopsis iheyensis]MCR6481312.1 uridine kinase [Amycolatopsis iheyensis]